MRVVFTVWPIPAHLYPITPLAWALQSAGHEVCIASHPMLTETTLSVGLTPVQIGDPATIPMGPGRPYPEQRAKLDRLTEALRLEAHEREPWDIYNQFMLPAIWDFHPANTEPGHPRPGVDDLVEFVKAWRPDLVFWDPCWPGAAVAARLAGAAHARLLWGQDYFAWATELFAKRADLGANPLVEAVAPVAERYGVDVDDELLHGQWTVDPNPPGVRLPTGTRLVPMRWVPYATQSAPPEWLFQRSERPRVALSLGLSQRTVMKGGWDHVPYLLEMVSGLDIEVIATLNQTQLGDVKLPGNVRAMDYVPLNQLLPTCAVLAHHGGMGTFATAAAFGVPQLITDSDVDNALFAVGDTVNEGAVAAKHIESSITAREVIRKHAGLPLDIRNLNADTMQKQLLRVLNEPEFRRGAEDLRADLLAAPTPAELIPVLERLTAGHRSGSGPT